MLDVLPRPAPRFALRALGTPALEFSGRRTPTSLQSLRKKDLALLIYLRLETRQTHSRSFLGNLLWGNTTEARARHSLDQAVSRLRGVFGAEAITGDRDRLRWRRKLVCDCVLLQEMAEGKAPADSLLDVYLGGFLDDFATGEGGMEFDGWADRRRVTYRILAFQVFGRLTSEAAEAGDWNRVLALGQRGVELDPTWEDGHRWVMRGWDALGERSRAVVHFVRFATWLRAELGVEPAPETTRLDVEIRQRGGCVTSRTALAPGTT
jgi:DNA-binding SARP family transcriptional activator